MNQNGIVAFREKLEGVTGRYHDFLGDEAQRICREHSVPTSENLQADLESIAAEGRLLKIGILGRVKSGKSSLLNALIFDGQSILPKAATPMTAALTTLSHGKTPSAEVEFFTQADIENIKANYDEYNRQWDDRYRTALAREQQRKTRSRSPEERAKSRANREMRENVELSAAHEQYEKMEATGESLTENRLLEFGSDSDLQAQLEAYVGADGRYMPFTKSVNIRLPQENLKDIEIVDTPGINDPVQSREERTREHLNQCDVVLVLSPSGQFLNTVDLELMDRITSKEGIRELFVVAAQADTQLFGNLKDENGGQLDSVLESLTRVLGDQLSKVIADLKDNNPEVGDTYDQLLEGQSKIIYSSGMCESLKQLFGQREKWDEGMQNAWGNLLYDYPDYFSDADARLSGVNLNKLSNISTIQNIVSTVRAKKDDIITQRRTEYIHAKRQSLHALKDGLLAFADERQSEIERTDIGKIKAQRATLTKALNDASWDIKLDYEESVTQRTNSLNRELRGELDRQKQALSKNIESAIGEVTETKERKKRGFFAWVARGFGGGYEQYSKTSKTIRTNAVSHDLSLFASDMGSEFQTIAKNKKTEWRNDLIKEMTKILREHFEDESLEASMIRRVIRNAVADISLPDDTFGPSLPKSLRPQGVLKGKKAEKFAQEADKYLRFTLYNEFNTGIKEYTRSLTAEMKRVRLDEQLLERTKKELDALEKSIENKEMELKRISRLKDELTKVEVNP